MKDVSMDDNTSIWLNVKDHCTGSGWNFKDAQMSFPSGHASAAFAGFVFLALWLNGKFKIFGQGRRSGLSKLEKQKAKGPGINSRIQHWKLVLFVAPWLVATIIAALKVRDNTHHPEDVIFGALIGTAFAHMAYRMVYRSIYDWRDNHIPREDDTIVDPNAVNPKLLPMLIPMLSVPMLPVEPQPPYKSATSIFSEERAMPHGAG